MIAETLPRLDLERLVRRGQRRGHLQLRQGVGVRFWLDLDDERVTLKPTRGAHEHHRLVRQPSRGATGLASVRCPDCGRLTQILCWFHPHLPGICTRCTGGRHLSSYPCRGLPELRADLRLGHHEPALRAIRSGDPHRYLAARIAIEREGFVADERRLFTLPDGRRRRWENLRREA